LTEFREKRRMFIHRRSPLNRRIQNDGSSLDVILDLSDDKVPRTCSSAMTTREDSPVLVFYDRLNLSDDAEGVPKLLNVLVVQNPGLWHQLGSNTLL
jgi:hypothetical protein